MNGYPVYYKVPTTVKGEMDPSGPSGTKIEEIHRIYVTLQNGTIVLLDGKKNTVIDTISFPIESPNFCGMEVDALQQKLYLLDRSSSQLVVISLIDFKMIKIIFLGITPVEIMSNPTTRLIYITCPEEEMLSILDMNEDCILKTIRIPKISGGLAINSITNFLYVATSSLDSGLAVVDGISNVRVTDIDVSHAVYSIGINKKTGLLYLPNYNKKTVSVVLERTNRVLTTIDQHIGVCPIGVAIHSNTNLIYVSNTSSNSISVIRGADHTVVDTIPVGSGPREIQVNETLNRIYVLNRNENSISVMDGQNHIVIATISLPEKATGMIIHSYLQ